MIFFFGKKKRGVSTYIFFQHFKSLTEERAQPEPPAAQSYAAHLAIEVKFCATTYFLRLSKSSYKQRSLQMNTMACVHRGCSQDICTSIFFL